MRCKDSRVRYVGQPAAMMLAGTTESACHAAGLAEVACADVAAPVGFEAGEPVTPGGGFVLAGPMTGSATPAPGWPA
jgi:CO/xanthine dehydrogenase Mo-binding subunit